ncbi:MAG: phosphodiester glycosidase family protein [Myxococcaceae bacterium]
MRALAIALSVLASSCATTGVVLTELAPPPVPAGPTVVAVRAGNLDPQGGLSQPQLDWVRASVEAHLREAHFTVSPCNRGPCPEVQRLVVLGVRVPLAGSPEVELSVTVDRSTSLESASTVFAETLPRQHLESAVEGVIPLLTRVNQRTRVLPLKTSAALEPGVEAATTGRLAEANSFFEGAVKARPDDARACWNSAVMQEVIGMTGEATASWERCERLEPGGAVTKARREFLERQAQRDELAALTPSGAGEQWSSPFPGVRLLVSVSAQPRLRMYAALVELSKVSLGASTPGERRTVVSELGKRHRAQLAINADFFSYLDYSTEGLAVGDGAPWPRTQDDAAHGVLAFGDGRVELKPASELVTFEPWMRGAVSGKPDLLRGGVVQPVAGDSRCGARHPRTAVGLTADGSQLVLVVVEGRSALSEGLTCDELAGLMKSLGASDALNLDGGGSATLWLQGQGVVNRPSDGVERPVGNALFVFSAK